MYMLLLYAAVVMGSGIAFFAGMEAWYGNWEVYNTYMFVIAGLFVLVGVLMLFDGRPAPEGVTRLWSIPVPGTMLGQAGLVVMLATAVALVIVGQSSGAWSIVLSVLLVAGFMMLLLASKVLDEKDGAFLTLFAAGLILLLLVPVHEAFDIARSAEGDYPFSAANMPLIIAGTTAAVLGLHFMRSRDGFFAAWLLGVMAVFLVTFHEQAGLLSSDSAEMYDRGVAAVGLVFSFVPLSIYLWREWDYHVLWRSLLRTNGLVRKGEFTKALKEAESAIDYAFDIGVSKTFALPYALKGDALYGLREYSKAKTSYETALEVDPDDDITWCQLGNVHAYEAKRALALSAYDRAIKINSRNAHAWNNKGVIFVSLAWPEEATTCFSKAVLTMPDNFDAHINLAKVCVRQGRHDEAVRHYQHAQELKPESPVARDGLEREFVMGQRMDQIRGWEQMGLDTSTLRRILKEDPDDFDKRSKEFLSSIVEQRTQLTIGTGREKFDVNEAIRAILEATESEGATMETIVEKTGLSRDHLVLPMALLMKTERLHFKQSGDENVYVSKGKAPEKPEPTTSKRRRKKVRVKAKPAEEELPDEEDEEEPEETDEEDEPEEPPQEKPKPKSTKKKGRRNKGRRGDDIEPTASVLVFGRK